MEIPGYERQLACLYPHLSIPSSDADGEKLPEARAVDRPLFSPVVRLRPVKYILHFPFLAETVTLPSFSLRTP